MSSSHHCQLCYRPQLRQDIFLVSKDPLVFHIFDGILSCSGCGYRSIWNWVSQGPSLLEGRIEVNSFAPMLSTLGRAFITALKFSTPLHKAYQHQRRYTLKSDVYPCWWSCEGSHAVNTCRAKTS